MRDRHVHISIYAHVVHVTTSCLVQAERPWSCLDVDAVRSALESELGGARYELDGVRCTVSRVQMRKCGGAEETNAAISQPVISAALLAPWLAPHGTWWVHAHAPVHDHGSRRKVHGECMHVLLSACAACSVCCMAWPARTCGLTHSTLFSALATTIGESVACPKVVQLNRTAVH